MFGELRHSSKILLEECVSLAYFMRGGIQYDDLMWRTPVERQVIGKFIKERLETESKRPYPNY